MTRPFTNASIDTLEDQFRARKKDPEFLRVLLHELGFRTTSRAQRLKADAERALSAASLGPAPQRAPVRPRPDPLPPAGPAAVGTEPGASPPRPTPPPRAPSPPAPPASAEPRADPPLPIPRHAGPLPPVSNTPERVMDAWTALEVLSPPSFRRPEELAGGDRSAVAALDGRTVPWAGAGERSRPNKRLYYQVVLGTVDLDAAVRQLLATYADRRAERPPVRGEAILAVVVVDRRGRPVEGTGCAISSFAWGVPRALGGDLASLAQWRMEERPLLERFEEMLCVTGDDGEVRPLTARAITAAFEWLVGTLGLPPALVSAPRFAIRTYEYDRDPDPPAPLLLNSFFLGDLAAARGLFASGRATANLRRYLGVDAPPTRRDLLRDTAALEAAAAPGLTPAGRWPGPGRHPLVLLQQAAVNLAMDELRDVGILAVNGPPGTGKTTLLRDVVAALVTRRAEAMAGFDHPEKAFTNSGERLKVGRGWFNLHRVDTRLKGFEMLVASSNNKAVENVSAELPAIGAVAADAEGLRYFRTLSDPLHARDTWGLAAAVLGNAANRGRFQQTFWWNKEVGLSTYLLAAAGTPQVIEEQDPTTGKTTRRPPRIVAAEGPPADANEALRRWEAARRDFRAALDRSRKALASLEEARRAARDLLSLATAEADAAAKVALARGAEARAREALAPARSAFSDAKVKAASAAARLAEHDAAKPGWLARLFWTQSARVWTSARAVLARGHETAARAHAAAAQAVAERETAVEAARAAADAAQREHLRAAAAHAAARRAVDAVRGRIGARFADTAFFARGHDQMHRSTPWLSDEDQRLRDDVFAAALRLHRAFIDAAARPLRHNLSVLMNVMGGSALPTAEKQALVPDLWSSLFLVVPLLSTTFASVERMLGALPPESLGWLLVDEAGQALPQAAVGALMRTRRAVVVGDPMQIEPVVTLPDTLTQTICRHFGVDPDRFNAPQASAQTLADAATPYVAEFEGRLGSRTVGVPLLVHRRCADPMFSVSNAIAYEGLMVNAKQAGASRIREVLGPSAWIDVVGSAEEKWCPDEGEAVLHLLRRLAGAGVVPDLYIVTPFVIVADHLRRLVRASGVLAGWSDDAAKWTRERIGTVHTVQGREAEAVILALGAPAPQQTGARNWAGYPPNLLNVAVTRAKEQLYVIGNRRLWREAGLFRELDRKLP